jgi:hypothetical protein
MRVILLLSVCGLQLGCLSLEQPEFSVSFADNQGTTYGLTVRPKMRSSDKNPIVDKNPILP